MFVLFAVGIVVGIFRNKNRSQHMQAEAQALGLAFSHWSEKLSASDIATPFFLSGSAGFKNVMTGSYAGMNVDVFDYSKKSGGGQNATITIQTVAVYSQKVDFPSFALGPGGLAGRIMDALEHENVDVSTDKEFLHDHAVRGKEKERIKALFSQPLIDFVKQLDQSKKWQIEGAGNKLVIYRYSRQVKPAALRDFLQETSMIAQSFFAHAGAMKRDVLSATASNRL